MQSIEKFTKLEEDKRQRIINAAMKEFRYGYKKASTDIIVKEAGISKGLLYHYFGTKEQLYAFLAHYALELIDNDFFDMMRQSQDILESFWQFALLKKDLTDQHPYLYDFVNGIYTHRDDAPAAMAQFEQEHEAVCAQLYDQCDSSLFRDDIDHRRVIDIISFTLDSMVDSVAHDDDYEGFLEALRGYFDIFRLCFYKKEK